MAFFVLKSDQKKCVLYKKKRFSPSCSLFFGRRSVFPPPQKVYTILESYLMGEKVWFQKKVFAAFLS